jgi:hypothetical protein
MNPYVQVIEEPCLLDVSALCGRVDGRRMCSNVDSDGLSRLAASIPGGEKNILYAGFICIEGKINISSL